MSDVEQFLRRFNEAWKDGDIEMILAGVTDDIRFRMASQEAMNGKKASQGARNGKKAFRDFLRHMENGGGQCSLDIDNVIVDGDRAVLDGVIQVESPEGPARTFLFCDVYRLRDDRISEITAYVVEKEGNH